MPKGMNLMLRTHRIGKGSSVSQHPMPGEVEQHSHGNYCCVRRIECSKMQGDNVPPTNFDHLAQDVVLRLKIVICLQERVVETSEQLNGQLVQNSVQQLIVFLYTQLIEVLPSRVLSGVETRAAFAGGNY